jgi:hypothetical protein
MTSKPSVTRSGRLADNTNATLWSIEYETKVLR